MTVLPGWIDYNGHMTESRYLFACSETTDAFLQHFGLTSRKDLPGIEDLRAAGLLDPVDLAFEEAMGELDLVKDGEEA